MKKCSSLLLALLLIILCVPGAEALPPSSDFEATILFTHDLHSHFLPQSTEDGGESGGYAPLKTAIDRERALHPNALLVDGGDFSIGSLIQTLYTTQAAELRTMGALGYDAATLGNHEFDHTGAGLARMLNAAADSGDRLPALVEANYAPAPDNPDRDVILAAMDNYGVAETMLFDRDGVTYGLFGLMGVDSHDCAPTSGFVLEDMVQAAQRCVEALEAQGAELILCLSHSGTEGGEGEDYALAKAVDGIDVIISGHTHATLAEPIAVNDTYIVSAGPYCRNLGSITLEKDGDALRLTDYHLTPIDETLPHDPDTAALVEGWKARVGETYLKRYGLTYDQVLAHSDFSLATPRSGIQEGNALGELVSDAFLYAANAADRAAGREPQVTVAVTADGVLRAPLAAGDITVSQVFDVLSMGVGSDDTSGFPLVAVYLTGADVKRALEVDASVSELMPAARLYWSGVAGAYNTNRVFFNRVYRASLLRDGVESEVEDKGLYRVVTGLYCGQMLGAAERSSFGLISITPRDASGVPISMEDLEDYIVRDARGDEVKEWYAVASYLQAMGSRIDARYAAPDGRKQVRCGWNPVELVQNPNGFTIAAAAGLALTALAVVLLTRAAVRRFRRRR